MSREVCGICWCPYDEETGECACAPEPNALLPRKPLTDEEIRDLWSWSMTAEAERTATTQQHAFARAIEAKHGIGDKDVHR